MWTNWSLSPSASFPPPPSASSNSSVFLCINHREIFIISTSFAITNLLLLLPFCILVLVVGLRRCWRQRSSSSMMSHSDVFTYHMVTMEMVSLCGCGVLCWGFFMEAWKMMMAGLTIISLTQTGQIIFHLLTCVERYLAVVHPIIYMGLKKNQTGLWIRNALLGCAWLLLFGMFAMTEQFNLERALFYLVFSLAVITFCNFSVLHALTHPGPGEGAGGQLNPSKRRAFHTIGAIMAVLLFRVVMHLLVVVMYKWSMVGGRIRCSILVSGLFFSLPSSLVLPLLFLHRAGKFTCRKTNTQTATCNLQSNN